MVFRQEKKIPIRQRCKIEEKNVILKNRISIISLTVVFSNMLKNETRYAPEIMHVSWNADPGGPNKISTVWFFRHLEGSNIKILGFLEFVVIILILECLLMVALPF